MGPMVHTGRSIRPTATRTGRIRITAKVFTSGSRIMFNHTATSGCNPMGNAIQGITGNTTRNNIIVRQAMVPTPGRAVISRIRPCPKRKVTIIIQDKTGTHRSRIRPDRKITTRMRNQAGMTGTKTVRTSTIIETSPVFRRHDVRKQKIAAETEVARAALMRPDRRRQCGGSWVRCRGRHDRLRQVSGRSRPLCFSAPG